MDTFGQYMNGGIHAGHVLPFLAANYVVGDAEPAELILQAMLQRLQLGLFQNGVWGESPHGAEWTTWDGEPCGADGYLADNFRFLEAVFLRARPAPPVVSSAVCVRNMRVEGQ